MNLGLLTYSLTDGVISSQTAIDQQQFLLFQKNGKHLGHMSIDSIWVNLPQLIKTERKQEKKVK